MGNRNNEDLVYTFKDVSFKVAGTSYCVAAIAMTLAENAIPQAIVTIDPAHTANESTTSATVATLTKMLEWYGAFQKHARNKATATFNMTIECVKAAEQQTLKLTDWIVTAAAMTPNVRGEITIKVTIQHPAYKLCESSAILGNPTKLLKLDVQATNDYATEDMVLAIRNTIQHIIDDTDNIDTTIFDECLTAGSTYLGETNISEALKASKKILWDVAELVPTYLVWQDDIGATYANWPTCGTCLTEFEAELKNQFCNSFVGFSSSNVWSYFVGDLAPSWGIGVVPYFWQEQLVVRPYTPWWRTYVTLIDTDLDQIVVGDDPSPKAGVQLTVSEFISANDTTVLNGKTAELIRHLRWITYIPKGAQGKNHIGSIDPFEPPLWLSGLAMPAAARENKREAGTLEAAGNQRTTGDNDNDPVKVENANAVLEKQKKIIGAYFYVGCQDFLTIFRQNHVIQVTGRLLIQQQTNNYIPGKYLIPGFVYAVASEPAEGGEPNKLLSFYCTQVNHTIDCQGGTASTSFTGAYVRSSILSGGTDSLTDIIQPGQDGDYEQPNPLYRT